MSQPGANPTRMPRGLLTNAERDAVRGDVDDPNKHSTYIARVKGRMERVQEDAEMLREYRPDLYEKLHGAVCEEELDERVKRLEEEVGHLRAQLDGTEHED